MGYSNILTLTGLPGSGKTTFGVLLAKSINYDFIDLDKYISSLYSSSIENIFSSLGEDTFRKYEHKALKTILNSYKNRLVLSMGGGSICSYNSLKLCLDKTKIIWLNTDLSVIIKWFVKKGIDNRPLLKNTNLHNKLLELSQSRLSFYENSHIKIDINEEDSNNISRVINRIINNLKVYGIY